MNDIQRKIGLALTIVSGLIIFRSWIKKWRKGPPKIKKLIIYPIKSLRGFYYNYFIFVLINLNFYEFSGFEVDHLDIVDTGVEWNGFHDRTMALVNAKNIMITQRMKPKLALITIQLEDEHIVLNAPGLETLKIPCFDDEKLITNDVISFDIWGQITEGYVCQKEFCEWFTRFLNIEIKLLRIGKDLKHRQSEVFGDLLDNRVVYQDGFPILMINDGSIDELNERLKGKLEVDYRRFRPNFLVENADAYEEDEWNKIRINNLEYYMPKPCDRCVLPTVDPDTGVLNPEMEPLKTLKTYRIQEKWTKKAPMFGINLIPKANGKIFIGDPLEIIGL